MSDFEELSDIVEQLPSLLEHRLHKIFELSSNDAYKLSNIQAEQQKVMKQLQKLESSTQSGDVDKMYLLELQDLRQMHNSALIAANMREGIANELQTVLQRYIRRFDDKAKDIVEGMAGQDHQSTKMRKHRVKDDPTEQGQVILDMIRILGELTDDEYDKAMGNDEQNKENLTQPKKRAKASQLNPQKQQRRSTRKRKMKTEFEAGPTNSGATARSHTRQSRQYCICRRSAFGKMIACDDSKCQFKWFHYECIGLTAPPRGAWYCAFCTHSTAMKSAIVEDDDDDCNAELDVLGVDDYDDVNQATVMLKQLCHTDNM